MAKFEAPPHRDGANPEGRKFAVKEFLSQAFPCHSHKSANQSACSMFFVLGARFGRIALYLERSGFGLRVRL
eukprot:3897523-Amphidinium_carterae.1